MIYKINLSDTIYEHLKDVVLLQAELLCFAANCPSKADVAEVKCATYLNEQRNVSCFHGRGETLAHWYWGIEQKKQFLTRFVEYQPDDSEQKRVWAERITKEIRELLDRKQKQIEIGDFFDGTKACTCKKSDTVCTWRGVASCFFLYFYETFLSSSTKFPTDVFSIPDAQTFGRDAFLKAFVKSNEKLLMCPFCDAGRHFISVGDSDSNYIYSAIDHFLPKSLYPHFACHPCNLVPTCHDCNSTFKGSKDPLVPDSKGIKHLSRSLLPYESGGHEQIYVQVTLTPSSEDSTSHRIASLELKARKENLSEQEQQEIQQRIKLLERIYQIPKRWQTMPIDETLFRRMRQFLNNGSEIPDSYNSSSEVYNRLEQLLYYLYREDCERDPLAFALTWTMVTLLREEQMNSALNQVDSSGVKGALQEEIESWFNGEFVDEIHKRAEVAKQLLQVPSAQS